jgi:hypothetical protein
MVWLMLPCFVASFVMISIIRDAVNASIGQPRPEVCLISFSGKKLTVDGCKVVSNLHKKYVTLFSYREREDMNHGDDETKNYPILIYCFTSEEFQIGEQIEIQYDPAFKMIGYYDKRCLRKKVEV